MVISDKIANNDLEDFMKKKILYLITSLVCVAAVIGVVSAFDNYNKEHQTNQNAVYNTNNNPLPTYSYTPSFSPSPTENPIKYLDIDCLDDKGYDHLTFTFKITNTSSIYSFTFVKVKVNILDEDKNVLTSDWGYAVDSVSLEPNESREFDILVTTSEGDKFKKFSWKVIDFDYA
jgi:hypothetical protein